MPDRLPSKDVFQQVFAHVTLLYREQMSTCLFFHTFNHTLEVLEACKEIGLHANLSPVEQEIVWIAACFHDTGYRHIYMGHEEESKRIAYQFLTSLRYGTEKTERVLGCIEATKIPQNPQTLIEQVLCDADLYHLSSRDYKQKEGQLRKEWECVFNKIYTDQEWDRGNLKFLAEHHYFTLYGKNVLEPRKQIYVEEIKSRLEALYNLIP